MKKCPYCKTLMNDDITSCPNCLKDVPLSAKMPEIVSSKNKYSFYYLIFGLIISIGSIVAAFSQRDNKYVYENQITTLKKQIQESSIQDEINHLNDLLEKAYSSQKACEFREYAFYVFCGVGVLLIVIGIVCFIKNRRKK